MRILFAVLACLLLPLAEAAGSTPAITQLFAFSCNADYSSCPDGMDPALTPIQLADGNFYGVTWWAGQNNANAGGTVWKVTPTGVATVVHTFQPNSTGQFPHGENPVIGFAQGADHNLYGVTESGGTTNQGVMYALATSGGFKVAHNFCTGTCKDIEGSLVLAKGSD
jgi:uncharacterized repeat protein (TIGR03803 family)